MKGDEIRGGERAGWARIIDVKDGRLYDGNTLDEVWPRQKKMERLDWWEDEPHTTAGMR